MAGELCSSLFIGLLSCSLIVSGHRTTPASRGKGEITCYSCFSLSYIPPDDETIPPRLFDENVTEAVQLMEEGGLIVPTLAPRCSDQNTPGNLNFYGAKLHVCHNTVDRPGTCVKLKGYRNGYSFVYRECWEQMWADPRPFQHRMSGKCLSDEKVQDFIATERNSICFCEDDLCNSAAQSFMVLVIPILVLAPRSLEVYLSY